jgi:hypothetical protein
MILQVLRCLIVMLASALFVFCPFAPLALASVNIKGMDGLINIPSAYVPLAGRGSVGYFYTRDGNLVTGNVSLESFLELSYTRWWHDDRPEFGLYSAKLSLAKEKVLSPAVAFGAEDISGKLGRNYYLVASKQAPFGLRLHVGASFGEAGRGVFYGLEKQIKLKGDLRQIFAFMPVFTVMMEYDGQNLNYGAYVRNSHGLRFDLAWRDERLLAGVQMEF